MSAISPARAVLAHTSNINNGPLNARASLKMALSLSSFLIPIAALASLGLSATVTYDFDIGWVRANPDGVAERPTVGINGQWPIPPITATKGDRIVVNAKNSLGNESTSLHFHGIYMNGSTHMDGPPHVTQCDIAPGSSFTYNFTVSSCVSFLRRINAEPIRLINQGLTGTTLIAMGSILMAFGDHSSFTTPIRPIRIFSMKRSFSPSQIGTMT